MNDIKKPYECRFKGCSMSFVTKDHLDVHVRKHDLSLTLTPSTPFKAFVDETPTPTRFLKELESEVFQELNGVNPFDATFRKANSGNPVSFHIPESSSLISSLPDSEVLNTPHINLTSEPESPIILRTNFAKKKLKDGNAFNDNSTNDTLPFTPDNQENQHNIVHNSLHANHDDELPEMDSSTFLSSESAFLDDVVLKTSTPNVVQTPVITSIGHTSLLKTTGVPTAVVVTRPPVNPSQSLASAPISVVQEKTSQVKVMEQPQAVVQSVCVTPMVQVIIRLPDGQTMPVQFPVMQTVPAPATTVQVPSTAVPSAAPLVHAQQIAVVENEMPNTTTKMKLKEVLTMNQKSSNVSKNGSTQVKGRINKGNNSLANEDMLTDFSISPPSSPMVQRPGHNGRKRREHGDNPEEKRKKSLERNRAAATRCREKRKVWITSLEQKADELESVNITLQHEVTQLRNEVAQLKTMLLAHKDCPVTLQQKGMVYAEKKSLLQIISRTSTEDVQRVPNSSMVSPLNAEFMEVEMGSVQSNSDASLTSDTSEASFKER